MSPSPLRLSIVALLAAAALAVGCNGEEAPAGPRWHTVTDGPGGVLVAVWGDGEGSVYTVGGIPNDAPGAGPSAYRLVDGAWSPISTEGSVTDGHLWWVVGVEDTVFMTGEKATILRHDPETGQTRREEGLPDSVPDDAIFYGLAGPSLDDLYTVGTNEGFTRGIVLHRGPDGWEDVAPLLPEGALDDIPVWKPWVLPSGDVWLVGISGLVLRLHEGVWEQVPVPVAPERRSVASLFTVHAGDDGMPVAVGSAGRYCLIVRWDGEQLVNDSPGECPGLTGVRVGQAQGGEAVAIGGTGAIMWRRDGVWEEDMHVVTAHDLHTAWIAPDGGTWASGGLFVGAGAKTSDGVLLYHGETAPPRFIRSL